MPKKVYAYIDGFNFFHALQHKIHDPKSHWDPHYHRCNFRSLIQGFLGENEHLHKVYFFTAYIPRDEPAQDIQKQYVQDLRKAGVDVVLGTFSQVTKRYVRLKNKLLAVSYTIDTIPDKDIVQELVFGTYEEKETDVNMSLKILEDGIFEKYDVAYIVSGDSDIIPAIKSVRRLSKKSKLEQKHFISLLLPGTKGRMIKTICDEVQEITRKQMDASILGNNPSSTAPIAKKPAKKSNKKKDGGSKHQHVPPASHRKKRAV